MTSAYLVMSTSEQWHFKVRKHLKISQNHGLTHKQRNKQTLSSIWDSCLKTSLLYVWRHVYPLLEHMFIACVETCLHHVCLYVYTMFEGMFTPCLKIFNFIIEDMFTLYLRACLHFFRWVSNSWFHKLTIRHLRFLNNSSHVWPW